MAEIEKIELKIPNLGDAESTEIIEVNIKAGDKVNLNDPLIVLESEKAAMEIPSDYDGEISEVLVATGDSAKEGMIFAKIISNEKTISKKVTSEKIANKVSQEPIAKDKTEKVYETNKSSSTYNDKILAGPAVRKYARELELDLTSINGMGKDGRITKDDLKRFIHQKVAPSKRDVYPSLESLAKFGPYKIENLSGIRKAGLKNLQNSWSLIPHVFHFEEINLTRINDIREKVKCSPLPVIVKAVSNTLKKHPLFNSTLLNDSEVLLKDYINIGLAVNTRDGLVVPVIKEVNKLTIKDIDQAIKKLSMHAREKQLKKTDIEGATFTISSLGKIGGQGFTPIINHPEVAILGISNNKKTLTMHKEKIIEELVLPISLSYDHRVINGVDAGEFMYDLKIELEEKIK